ncbi:hypothetical protein KIN20_010117 [Parelaphostrongylus tenuis]|uniref:Uncharacterized protein n=1 Tax=Parelaphostrongylus tenuis TaxID=148309 RepID=A0AAD5MC34_PARTN|nr:hypothetical protein KIN20_010117 [Parelaphostrongylus tenuis]
MLQKSAVQSINAQRKIVRQTPQWRAITSSKQETAAAKYNVVSSDNYHQWNRRPILYAVVTVLYLNF